MLKSRTISQTGDYYYLPSRKELVAHRLTRSRLSAPQLLRAKSLARKLSPVPGVMAIYLTGSLAMQNSDSNSDIDFMVITQQGRLWTTRLILTVYTSLFRLRRTPGSTHNRGKVCLNLYLTPTSFHIPKEKQSLYTAYELIQAVPLYDPRNTQVNLLAANPWIHKYLPNFPHPTGPGLAGLNYLPARPGPIGTLFELIYYHLQLWYMSSKLTREYVTPDSAFFHPKSPAPKV